MTANVVSLYVLLLFFSNPVLLRSHDFRLRSGRSSLSEEEERHVFLEGKCQEKFSRVIAENKCEPRPTVVNLEPTNGNLQMNPSSLVVKRCAGSCSSKKSCIPTDTKEIWVPVKPLDAWKHNYICGHVRITEHVNCTCKCSQMPRHCTEKQVYDAKNCMCLCKDQMEKMRCQTDGKYWDERRCKCSCLEKERECSTGLEWIPSFCRCAAVMMMDESLYNNF